MEPELFKNWEALKSNGKIGLRRILRAYNIIFTHRGGKTLKLLVKGLFEREKYHSCCMNLGYLIYPCDLRWWKDDDSSRKAFPAASLAQNSTSTSAVSFRICALDCALDSYVDRAYLVRKPRNGQRMPEVWSLWDPLESSSWSENSMSKNVQRHAQAKNGRLEGWKDDQLLDNFPDFPGLWPISEFHIISLCHTRF